MVFLEEFQNTFIKQLDKAERGHPCFILVEKEPGASNIPVMGALSMAEKYGACAWTAQCCNLNQTPFEQLLPASQRHLLRIEKPPRIELALLADKKGMNLGTVKRDDTSLDPDIISGMMAAVRNFIKDSLAMHSGETLEDGDVESFNMHGYNILVCPGEILNLTLIMSGSIPDMVVEEAKRITGEIEADSRELLGKWNGSMSEVAGIEAPVALGFFASKQYEGQWDYEQLRNHRSRMFDNVLRVVQAQSRTGTLVMIVEDMEKADRTTLELFLYILKNQSDSNLVFMGTVGAEPEMERKEWVDLVEEMMGRESFIKMNQPADIDIDSFIETIEPNVRAEFVKVLEHCTTLGTVDAQILVESTGLDSLELSDILDSMYRANIIGLGGSLNPSVVSTVTEKMDETMRLDIMKKNAPVYEKQKPEDCVGLANIFCKIAAGDPEFRQKALTFAITSAEMYTRNFNWENAVEMWLAAFANEDDRRGRLEHLWNAMELEWHMLRFEDIVLHSEEMLAGANKLDDERFMGLAHWMMGRLHTRKNENDRALDSLTLAEKHFRAIGDTEFLLLALNTRGTALNKLGERDRAAEIYRDILDQAEMNNILPIRPRTMVNLAYIHILKKEWDEANRLLLSAKEMAGGMGLSKEMAPILWHLSLLEYHRGNYSECIEYCNMALERAREMGDWRATIQALTTLAAAHEKNDDVELSDKCVLDAYTLSRKTDTGDLLALTYNVYETHYRKQLDFLNRTIALAKSGKVHAATVKQLKSEILVLFTEEVEALSRIIDNTAEPEERRLLTERLHILLDKLNV